MKPKQVWSVYLLVSPRGRTYIGATVDPARRLRQHNREIQGGAKATGKESNWKLAVYVTGFISRSQCYRWEALVKKRNRGYTERLASLVNLPKGICPPSKKGYKMYKVPEGLSLIIQLSM